MVTHSPPETSDSRYPASLPGHAAQGERLVWRRLLQYPPQATFFALAVVCLAAPLLVGGIAWRTLQQLERIGAETEQGERLHEVDGLLQHLVSEQHAGAARPDPTLLAQLRSALASTRAGQRDLRPAGSPRLDQVQALLATPGPTAEDLERAAHILDELAREEGTTRRELVSGLRAEARAELGTATLLFVGLAVLGLAGAWGIQRRVLRPLRDLRTMFLQLGAGDFSPIALEGAHPVLSPLFANYNLLVTRLEELEAEHRTRAEDLQREIQTAAEALLAQQRTLARAERLAAVGEMAAGLAHELRNPLAGVQMSLANLRRDLGDPQLVARLELAIVELERLARLLNHQLSASRHVPEAPRPLHLRTLVEELLTLLRYQVPAHVRLEARVDENIECRLPRDRLRQALLNLVLNSVQALGDDEGTVRLEAHREADRMVLVVTDDGPGFPPELVKAGGVAFVTRRAGGTGLGLAMVRRLAMDLGGELALENLDPRGARVRLALPCDGDA
jgi:two-component system NtrC family sensor kinase